MTDSDLYELKLHDEIVVGSEWCAMRVPGGWIYSIYSEVEGENKLMSTCFVPYSEEFITRKQYRHMDKP